MPLVRDPQGHTFKASNTALEAGAPCKECGWICTLANIVPDTQEPSPEPEDEPFDTGSADDQPTDDEAAESEEA